MPRPLLNALAVALLACAATAHAQTPRTFTLRADNDAFNFWTSPWERPDGEYTSGVHITYEGGAAPRWSPSFMRTGAPCTNDAPACHTARFEIGQDIYTPLLRTEQAPPPGARPNAGWLYVSQSARALKPDRSDELTVTVGVTGPPSLARFTQNLAHSAAPEFNRPTDWSRQIGFEPGAIVRYERRQRAFTAGTTIGLDLIPSFAASLGNVVTDMEIGLQSRTGLNLRHPWLPQSGPVELALTGSVSTRFVARDLFLDGNTFRPGHRVGHRPVVGTGDLALELRHKWLRLIYRTVTTTRAYDAGPKWHPWSSLVASVTLMD